MKEINIDNILDLLMSEDIGNANLAFSIMLVNPKVFKCIDFLVCFWYVPIINCPFAELLDIGVDQDQNDDKIDYGLLLLELTNPDVMDLFEEYKGITVCVNKNHYNQIKEKHSTIFTTINTQNYGSNFSTS